MIILQSLTKIMILIIFLNHNEQKVYLETNITFINAHSLLLILDVYFILLIDKLFNIREFSV